MKVRLTQRSGNRKTGPIPVSTTERDSCPDACPLRGNGCYAESYPLRGIWDSVPQRGMDWSEFCEAIAALPAGQLWRHNQAGDLPGQGDAIDRQALLQLVDANKGKRGFTYTHKPVPEFAGNERLWRNAQAIYEANEEGFTVNLSANNLAHADKLAALEIAPVVTVLPADQNTNTVTPAGRKVVVCPATQRDDVTCASCQLCQRADRPCIVGFPAHGASKRKASQIALGE